MKIKRFLVFLLVSLMGLGGVGCSPKSKEITKVRIGFFPNITHSQALIGKSEGQFEKAIGDKYTIEWKEFNAGPAELESLYAGEVDIGYIGPGPAINGFTNSKGDIQIIAGASNAGAVLVARKDAAISSVKDLEGKKVAVPQFGNTQDLSLRALLKANGLKDKTKGGSVEIVQSENADTKNLLDQGRVDAAIVPEPWGSRYVKEVGAKIILDYKDVWRDGDYSTAVVVARKDFIKDHPDIVENFLKAHVEVTDYINNDLENAKTTVNKELDNLTKKSLQEDILDSAFRRLISTYNPEKAAIAEMVDLSLDVGFIKRKTDLKDLYSLDLLNKVLKEKGKAEIK